MLQALEKKDKAEKLLAELEKEEIPKQPEADIEGITEEERYMLRKVGLRMKPFLLLGESCHIYFLLSSVVITSNKISQQRKLDYFIEELGIL